MGTLAKTIMTDEEAFHWLDQVDASILHNEDETPENRWVAVVKAPAESFGSSEHVILAFAETFLEATAEAEAQWHAYWSNLRHWH